VLDVEKLKLKLDSLSEKQRGLVLKVDGLRRRIKKLLDANHNQNSKKFQEFSQQLGTAEEKLRTSLKSSKKARNQNDDSENSESDGPVARPMNSDDEFDEYFDRTKIEPKASPVHVEPTTETYTSLKQRLESLVKERQAVTVDMRNV